MTEDKIIDINLLKDKSTFDKIQEQKSVFIELLTEIANCYPQHKLVKIHPLSKGTKVSQGVNLDNCPYQVLDIFRDFDVKSGLNIRILNWWGHGLYVFFQFGREIAILNEDLIFERLLGFSTSTSADPFDYKTILMFNKSLIKEEFENDLNKFSPFVLYKEIAYQKTPREQTKVLLENINLILDKDSQNFRN